jgi:hypothetical protein
MSMIDCKVNVDKKPDPKGDRVILTFESVFVNHLLCNNLILMSLVESSYLTQSGKRYYFPQMLANVSIIENQYISISVIEVNDHYASDRVHLKAARRGL